MDYMLLGLLILRSRTIYELQQAIDRGLNLMYSASMGSIQAALRKLLAAGYITATEAKEGGRKKKIYEITDPGREAFSRWVSSPMDSGVGKNPQLGKLYFMGFSDPESRCENIRAYIASLREPCAVLCSICQQAETMEVPPEAREILHYQAASARFGRDLLKFQIQWYEDFLKEEEEKWAGEKRS